MKFSAVALVVAVIAGAKAPAYMSQAPAYLTQAPAYMTQSPAYMTQAQAYMTAAQAQATATITGVVVTTDSAPQPIAGAVVTMTGGASGQLLSAITDETGRFVLSNLTPGRYSVSASKPAYVPMAYGATRPGRPGVTIAVAAGPSVNIQVALPRGGVITGTIRDQLGDPAADVQVLIARADRLSTSGQMYIENIVSTDDRGVYRVYGLMPDDYIVSALPGRFMGGEMFAPSRDEVDAKLRRLELRFAQSTIGGSAPPAAADQKSAPVAPEVPFTIGATYYPGTPVAGDAARIRVAMGEERRGVDIRLVPLRTVKVSGMIQAGEIPPQQVRPQLLPAAASQGIFISSNIVGPAADGSFTFLNVAPGRYVLFARTGPGALMFGPGGADLPPMFATTDITVGDTDVNGIVLALRPATSVSGKVVFDGTSSRPPENMELVRLNLTPAPGGAGRQMEPFLGSVGTNARSDGTFRLTGVVPGAYTLTSTFTGWWLRSVMVNGRDILDVPLEVDGSAADTIDARVTFTDRRSELHGTLTTASGQPASEFTVVVYPVNREFWRQGARRVRSVRPASDGAFSVMDLPPGDYLVAAVTDAEPDEWQQPSFLEQLVSASVKVSIAEGQRTRQDLRIGR
jgi:uncharacterized protein (DUF2141 family)